MKDVFIYNTMTREKEKFTSLEPGKIKMYCCGPTVYGLLHVGNFRGAIFYNLLRNWFEHLGYKVTYVYNYTDVDDKIIDRAKTDNTTSEEVAKKYIAEFEKDFGRLELKKHDINPKVTDTMPEIIQMISDLIKKEKAYAVNGEVLFSIRSFSDYGKLSQRKPDDLMTAVRIERDEKKRDPLDFALWKPAKPGEPSWESPWGPGRPGWHIECSAMIRKHLGEKIDIHGGGIDLLFPHHENEIAQSEGCLGHGFVNYWVHNNMLNVAGTKMSKSLGNFTTGRDFMTKYHPEILKYAVLSSHYRSVSDFSESAIDNSIRGLARIYSSLATAKSYLAGASGAVEDAKLRTVGEEAWGKIETALCDDFNTPEVFAAIFEVVRVFNGAVKKGMKSTPALVNQCYSFTQFLARFGKMASLFLREPNQFLTELDDLLLVRMNLERKAIDEKVNLRTEARKNKDFKKSDEIRQELLTLGISVNDSAEGSHWEVTK